MALALNWFATAPGQEKLPAARLDDAV